ncbi:putative uncharacterized protein DDB_G0282129 [Penaeus japonicus]|uniref:putative uncharacterized protein DDB_G0282129 n=1 Tax=Penaeus japonicus TaxID=27405 RepID=UPI001C710B83|nr:putative uncharacterized protein DDB_G0282129 [Penaeus japonicus]
MHTKVQDLEQLQQYYQQYQQELQHPPFKNTTLANNKNTNINTSNHNDTSDNNSKTDQQAQQQQQRQYQPTGTAVTTAPIPANRHSSNNNAKTSQQPTGTAVTTAPIPANRHSSNNSANTSQQAQQQQQQPRPEQSEPDRPTADQPLAWRPTEVSRLRMTRWYALTPPSTSLPPGFHLASTFPPELEPSSGSHGAKNPRETKENFTEASDVTLATTPRKPPRDESFHSAPKAQEAPSGSLR